MFTFGYKMFTLHIKTAKVLRSDSHHPHVDRQRRIPEQRRGGGDQLKQTGIDEHPPARATEKKHSFVIYESLRHNVFIMKYPRQERDTASIISRSSAIAALLQQGSKAVEGPELELAGSASPHVVRYSATAGPILLAARTLRSTIELFLQPHRAAGV